MAIEHRSFGKQPWAVLNSVFNLAEALKTVPCLGYWTPGDLECSQHCDVPGPCQAYQQNVLIPLLAARLSAEDFQREDEAARLLNLKAKADPRTTDGKYLASDLITQVESLENVFPVFATKAL